MFHLRNSHMLFRFFFPLALCVIRISCVFGTVCGSWKGLDLVLNGF